MLTLIISVSVMLSLSVAGAGAVLHTDPPQRIGYDK